MASDNRYITVRRDQLEPLLKDSSIDSSSKETLQEFLDQNVDFIGKKSKKISVDLRNVNRKLISLFAKLTLEEADLNLLNDLLSAAPDDEVSSIDDLYRKLISLTQTDNPGFNIEVNLNGRWYPAYLSLDFFQTIIFKGVFLETNVYLGDQRLCIEKCISSSLFKDGDGSIRVHKIQNLLMSMGFRFLQGNQAEYGQVIQHANDINSQRGKQFLCKGSAWIRNKDLWDSLEVENFGSANKPEKVIIERELETDERKRSRYDDERPCSELPIVRAFSLSKKDYIYADVRDLEEYEFSKEVVNNLELPPDIFNMLDTIFKSDLNKLFGDISVPGKHGGMVILATGNSGVGKTMTAEVFAEKTARPLYILEIGELGVDLHSVEQNLQKVFRRAARWNALLLMDEADIFMAKRDDNLERSAIVGVFLRLLDYYPGILFLTTNRLDVIDPAFASRITLTLNYPDLNIERRMKIWKNMFEKANIKFDPDGHLGTDGNLRLIAEEQLNGRQIRNSVRLLCCLYPDRNVTVNNIRQICNFCIKP